MMTLCCHVVYLQSCFDIFIVIFCAPFPLKSFFFFGAVKCRRLKNTWEKFNNKDRKDCFLSQEIVSEQDAIKQKCEIQNVLILLCSLEWNRKCYR